MLILLGIIMVVGIVVVIASFLPLGKSASMSNTDTVTEGDLKRVPAENQTIPPEKPAPTPPEPKKVEPPPASPKPEQQADSAPGQDKKVIPEEPKGTDQQGKEG